MKKQQARSLRLTSFRRGMCGASVMLALGVWVWPASSAPTETRNFVIVERVSGVNAPEMFVPDQFIVVLNRDARRNVNATFQAGRPAVKVASLQDVIDRNQVTRFEREFRGAKPQAINSKFPDLTGHYSVQIGPGVDLDRAMNAFARNPNVDHVEKIGIHPVYLVPNDSRYKLDPPDPAFPFDQWHFCDRDVPNFPNELFSVQADLAWDTNTGDSTVVVAGLDTGVRYFHSDLGGSDPPGPTDNVTNGNVWVNPFEIPGNGIDDEGNGFIDDQIGYDFVTGLTGTCCDTDCNTIDNDPRDHNGHGTHTAGTWSAISNNANRVAGLAGGFAAGSPTDTANGVQVMSMRIGWSAKQMGQCGAGFVRMDFAAQAMSYVADMKSRGINVAAVNCSWGSSNSGGLNAAVDALLAADVMVIHSAGNSNSTNPDFLGNKAGVMNVAATDRNGVGASFTNSGSWVDLAAPGVDVLSTWHSFGTPGSDFIAVLSGTSMSAPHACGVAALLESCNSGLTGPQKFAIMVDPANVRAYNDARDLGSGILNANLALADGCGAGCMMNSDCGAGEICCSGSCLTAACNVNGDCDDSNECTTDTCSNGGTCTASCSNTNVADDTSCSTGGTICCGGTCTNPDCTTNGDCDDSDACTTDTCNNGGTCASSCSNVFPACGPADGCCGPSCTPGNDPDCACGLKNDPCDVDDDCCSLNCRPSGKCAG